MTYDELLEALRGAYASSITRLTYIDEFNNGLSCMNLGDVTYGVTYWKEERLLC